MTSDPSPIRLVARPDSGTQNPDEDSVHLERAAQRGDVASFETLYRRHVGRIYAICLRMSGSRSLAEELVQDTFVRAWEGMGKFEPGTNFGAWISRVAINVILTDQRARKRRLARETVATALPRGGGSQSVSASTQRMDLDRAIGLLPPGARRVFVLHDVEGYHHTEIAQMLSMSTGSSKAQLHRARNTLRQELKR